MTFATWAPIYAERGIATFPVAGKKPAVSNYLSIGVRGSAQLAHKFPEAESFGFALKRNRIVLVDVDTTDARARDETVKQFGSTPLMVRTQSGGWHLYYRHAGEGRRIRCIVDPPVDLLGDGFAVAAPSIGAKGRYEIVRGSLDDLARLPPIRPNLPAIEPAAAEIQEGRRNTELWRHCMKHARHCDDLDALMDVAMWFNKQCQPPLSEAEVIKTATKAWDYEVKGNNWFGTRGMVALPRDVLKQLDPDETHLLMRLREAHAGLRETFAIALNAADALNMTRWTLRAAIEGLLAKGHLQRVHVGGRCKGDPSLYCFRCGQ